MNAEDYMQDADELIENYQDYRSVGDGLVLVNHTEYTAMEIEPEVWLCAEADSVDIFNYPKLLRII